MRRRIWVLSIASAVVAVVAVGAAPLTASGAGTAQNYLVVYKSE